VLKPEGRSRKLTQKTAPKGLSDGGAFDVHAFDNEARLCGFLEGIASASDGYTSDGINSSWAKNDDGLFVVVLWVRDNSGRGEWHDRRGSLLAA
jgi:hypothetical protein